MLYNLIFNLLIVHIICDFYLQTPSMCENKIKHPFKGAAIWIHIAEIGFLSWFTIWDAYGWWLVLLIVCSHLIIDWLKSYLLIKCDIYKIGRNGNLISGDNQRYDLYLFIGDQFLHIMMIALFSYWWWNMNDSWVQFQWVQTMLHNHPIRVYTAIALLLALKPVNIFILQILKSCKLGNETNAEDQNYFHAGALIGYTERCLILLFVILNQYEAIGFLIAAKSILRFSEASSGNVKSEYVLSGTLLSLVFSLLLGLCVIKMPIL